MKKYLHKQRLQQGISNAGVDSRPLRCCRAIGSSSSRRRGRALMGLLLVVTAAAVHSGSPSPSAPPDEDRSSGQTTNGAALENHHQMTGNNNNSNRKRRRRRQQMTTMLVCEDDGGQLGDGSVSCRFNLPKDAVDAMRENRERHPISMSFCFDGGGDDDDESDGNEFCIKARVEAETREKFGPAPGDDDEGDDDGTFVDNNVDLSLSDEDGDDQEGEDLVPRVVKIDPDDGTITVGDIPYRKPYMQHGGEVSKALRTPLDVERNTDIEVGVWLYLLGLAHESQAAANVDLESESSAGIFRENHGASSAATGKPGDYYDSVGSKMDKEEFRKALNAFEMASRVLEGVRNRGDQPEADYASAQLAGVYFQTSEAHSLMGLELQKAGGKKSTAGLDYMTKAEKIYRELASNSEHARRLRLAGLLDETRSSWAMCCMRLGILTLETVSTSTQIDPFEIEDLTAEHGDLVALMTELEPAEAEKILGKTMKSDLEKLLNTERHFDQAIEIYTETLKKAKHQQSRSGQIHYDLAMAHQNKVTPTTMRGAHEDTVQNAEKAVEHYELALGHKGRDHAEKSLIITQMAQLLYLMCDSYLHMGKYDEASDSFERSMELHEEHDLPPIELATARISNEEATIGAYETALEEYKANVLDSILYTGDLVDDIMLSTDQTYYYKRSDAYEGNLHAAIGSIYLNAGDFMQADTHLSQAVLLYEMSIARGEDEDDEDDGGVVDDIDHRRALADTKYNLAVLRSQSGQFTESCKVFREALELYRITVGEGNNPVRRDGDDVTDLLSSVKPITVTRTKDDDSGGSGATSDGGGNEQAGKAGHGSSTDEESVDGSKKETKAAELLTYWSDFKDSLENETSLADEL